MVEDSLQYCLSVVWKLLSTPCLFTGFVHLSVISVCLCHAGHSPGPDLEFAENRESYALTAGLSLGMIALGVGAYQYYQSLCTVVKCSSVCIFLFSSLSSFVSQAGDNSVGLSDLNLEDKLCVYINGGAKSFVRLKTNTTC